jgi:hypothetical protein
MPTIQALAMPWPEILEQVTADPRMAKTRPGSSWCIRWARRRYGGDRRGRQGSRIYRRRGPGGDDSDHPGLVEIAVDDLVVPLDDGTIPVQSTCSTDLDCEGAVIVAFSQYQ